MKLTKDFLEQVKGLVYNADLGCFTDPADGTNWWAETYRHGFMLRNRDTGERVDPEFAASVVGAQERGGSFIRSDGTTFETTIKYGRPQIKKG